MMAGKKVFLVWTREGEDGCAPLVLGVFSSHNEAQAVKNCYGCDYIQERILDDEGLVECAKRLGQIKED